MRYFGVDWYPEQWGMDHVDEDLDMIKELGANLIRIGDFAWDRFEPEEGRYDFTFFDEVIERAKKRGLNIMMCVPTATMTSWMYRDHPDIMNVSDTGYVQPFGARRGYCLNSDFYRKKATELAYAMGRHYKDEKAIVAWQVDNEIGHEGSDVCFCDTCRKKFDDFLRNRYPDIEGLNERWGTSFWTHTYSDFDEIPIPKPSFTAQNPSLRLEWARFRSESAVSYIDIMVKALKGAGVTVPVCHDFEGGTINKAFNPFDVAETVDFVAYNNYPVWGGQRAPMSDSDICFTVDFARGFKRDAIWITESIMGAQGHNDIGYAPKPGEAKKWALESLDHGVESLIFFRFRGFTKGAEQFCFGILDPDNVKRRRFYETQEFFSEAKKRPFEYPKSRVCIVYDYDSKSSMQIQRQSDAFSYEQECMKLYNQMYRRGMNCDIIDSKADFSMYDTVILPYMIIMDDDFRERLERFISDGGKAVMTPRTAWKDKDNNLVFGKRLPVDLTDITGCMIEEHEALLSGVTSPCEFDGKEGKGYIFEELLTLKGGKKLIAWKDNQFGDFAAAVENVYGKGRCYYLGSSFDEDTLTRLFDLILG
ncbi:MAG: beta-galactosidase [Clostridia bacterium]|nr:beta-galactosidase [Clostridia bacterium]